MILSFLSSLLYESGSPNIYYFIGVLVTCILGFVAAAQAGKGHHSKRLHLLKKLTSMINQKAGLDSILKTAVKEVVDALGMDASAIQILPADGSTIETFSRGFSKKTTDLLKKVFALQD